jgi:hypothetical protein
MFVKQSLTANTYWHLLRMNNHMLFFHLQDFPAGLRQGLEIDGNNRVDGENGQVGKEVLPSTGFFSQEEALLTARCLIRAVELQGQSMPGNLGYVS